MQSIPQSPILDHLYTLSPDKRAYLLRELIAHLIEARAFERLHLLVTKATEDTRNFWYVAKNASDLLGSFIADIEKIQETNQHFHFTHETLNQIQYTLMLSSVRSITRNVPGDLLVLFAEEHIWSVERCLTYCKELRYHAQRALTYARLMNVINPMQRQNVLYDLLQTVQQIPGPDARAEALVSVVPLLPRLFLDEVLERALDAIDKMGLATGRAKLVAQLAPFLTATQFERAMRIIKDVGSKRPDVHTAALINLIPYLPPQMKDSATEQALQSCLAISERYEQSVTLANLSPFLSQKHSPVAFALFDTFQNVSERVLTLSGLMRLLPAEEQNERIDWIFSKLYSIRSEERRMEALQRIVPLLSSHQLRTVVNLVQQVQSESVRARTFHWLLPHLPSDLQEEVAESIIRFNEIPYRLHFLTLLKSLGLPSQSVELDEQILSLVSQVEVIVKRSEMLATLSPMLSPQMRQTITKQAAMMVETINDSDAQLKMLCAILMHAPLNEQHLMYEEVSRFSESIQDTPLRLSANLTALPYLPPEYANQLALSTIPLISEAYKEYEQATALARLLPFVSDKSQILVTLLEFTQKLTVEKQQGQIITSIARFLNADQKLQIAQFVEKYRAPFAKAQILIALASGLPIEPRQTIVQQVLDTVKKIDMEGDRRVILLHVAPIVTESLSDRVLSALATIEQDPQRLEIIIAVINQLPVAVQTILQAEIRQLLRSIWSQARPANVVASIAIYQARQTKFKTAFKTIRNINDPINQARALVGMSSILPLEFQAEALQLACSLRQDAPKALALSGLLPYCDDWAKAQFITDAMQAGHTEENNSKRQELFIPLVEVATSLPQDSACKLLYQNLRIISAKTRRSAIDDLVSFLALVRHCLTTSISVDYWHTIRDTLAWWP